MVPTDVSNSNAFPHGSFYLSPLAQLCILTPVVRKLVPTIHLLIVQFQGTSIAVQNS